MLAEILVCVIALGFPFIIGFLSFRLRLEVSKVATCESIFDAKSACWCVERAHKGHRQESEDNDWQMFKFVTLITSVPTYGSSAVLNMVVNDIARQRYASVELMGGSWVQQSVFVYHFDFFLFI